MKIPRSVEIMFLLIERGVCPQEAAEEAVACLDIITPMGDHGTRPDGTTIVPLTTAAIQTNAPHLAA